MKLDIETRSTQSDEILARNTALSFGPPPVGIGNLAVVGGGPSVRDHVDDLRDWPGDIWAINGAWRWLKDQGIAAKFYSADAALSIAGMCRGADAVLAAQCDPSAYKAARRVWRITGRLHGPTSAVAAALSAIEAGYSEVTYFGCESSYGATTHAYDKHVKIYYKTIIVSCDGVEYFTNLGLTAQAERIAAMINAAPHVFHERSAGMLGGMVRDPEWNLVAGSQSLHDQLEAA